MGRLIAWLMPYLWPLAGVAFLALGIYAGWQTVQLLKTERDLSEVKAAWAQDREQAAERARKAEADARAEEQRRTAAQLEAINVAEQKATQARADLAIADAAAGRLRERVAALVAAAREAASNSQAVQPGPPAGDAPGMLADLLGRCVARAGLLARVADERGIAGSSCERQYDSLTAGVKTGEDLGQTGPENGSQ